MAKDAKPADTGAEGAPPKKNKKMLIIIVAAVFALVLIGGGAAFFLLKKKDHSDEDEDAAEEAPKKKEKKKKDAHGAPAFVSLEPFTVNLAPESGEQYLQVILSVEIDGPEGDHAIKAAMPKIRNNITLLLSSKKASELYTKEGKLQLAEELKNEINVAIEPPTRNKRGELIMPEGPAQSVLFTNFIIQ